MSQQLLMLFVLNLVLTIHLFECHKHKNNSIEAAVSQFTRELLADPITDFSKAHGHTVKSRKHTNHMRDSKRSRVHEDKFALVKENAENGDMRTVIPQRRRIKLGLHHPRFTLRHSPVVEASGYRRTIELPSLDELLKGTIKDTQFDFSGCKINVAKGATKLTLDLTDKTCAGTMSLERVFKKLAGVDITDADVLAPPAKFNVAKISIDLSKKEVEFSMSAKEPFDLIKGTGIKVNKAVFTMSFTYEKGKVNLLNVMVDISGEVTFGSTKVTVALKKEKGKSEGRLSIQIPSIKLADFYKAFTGSEKLESEAETSSFTETRLTSVTIIGKVNAKFQFEFFLEGTGKLGNEPGSFNVVIKKDTSISVGVVVKVTGTGLAGFLTSLSGVNLNNAPLIKDMKSIEILYANKDLTPKDAEITKALKKTVPTNAISRGLAIKFEIDLKAMVQGYTGTNPLSIGITIVDGKVIIDLPEDIVANLLTLLTALIPIDGAIKQVFPTQTKVKMNKYEVDITTGAIDIEMKATDVKIGKDLLTVHAATFALTYAPNKPWGFKMSAEKKIGKNQGLMTVTIQKEGDKYTLKGSVKSISTADIQTYMNAKSLASKLVENIPALAFEIQNAELTSVFGPNTPLDVKVTGTALFNTLEAQIEGHIVEAKTEKLVLAFGLLIQQKSFNEFAKGMFGKRVTPIESVLLKQLVIILKMENLEAVKTLTYENEKIQAFLGPGGQRKSGLTFKAGVVIPDSCGPKDKEDTICEFVKKKLGAKTEIALTGNINEKQLVLEFAVEGTIPVSERFALRKVAIKISMEYVALEVKLSLEGSMDVKMKEQTIEFYASLAVTTTGKVQLTLQEKGMIQSPFGIPGLSIGDLTLSVGFSFATMGPIFELGGTVKIGNGPKPIVIKVLGGLDTGVSGKFFFSASLTRADEKEKEKEKNSESLDMNGLLAAYISDSARPSSVKNIVIKEISVGVSLPGAHEDGNGVVLIPKGLSFYGSLNIMQQDVTAEIRVNLPKEFLLSAKVAKAFTIANIITVSSVDQKSGPEIKIAVDTKAGKFTFIFDAYIDIANIVGAGGRIEITEKNLFIRVTAQVFKLFKADLVVEANYATKFEERPANLWKVKFSLTGGDADSVSKETSKEVGVLEKKVKEVEKDEAELEKDADEKRNKRLAHIENLRRFLKAQEKAFDAKVEEIENLKKKTNTDCQTKCSTTKITIGGLSETGCNINDKNVKCSTWKNEMKTFIDPACLTECQAGKCKAEKECKEALGKLELIKVSIKKYKELLKKARPFFGLVERLKNAVKVLVDIKDWIVEQARKIPTFIKENIVYIEKVDFVSKLDKAHQYTFKAHATVYIGGTKNNNKPTPFEAEITLSSPKELITEVAKKIARSVFSVDKVEEKVEEFGQKKTEAEAEIKKIETGKFNEKEYDIVESRTIDDDIDIEKYMNTYISKPDLVIRDDFMMESFRDTFNDIDDDEMLHIIEGGPIDGGEGRTLSTDTGEKPSKDMNLQLGYFDPSNLFLNTTKCKLARNVIGTYKDMLDVMNFMQEKNRIAKEGYMDFVQANAAKFDRLHERVMKDATLHNYTADELEDALFYVELGKKGTQKWKKRWDSEFDFLDKASFRHWKDFMVSYLADKNLDIPQFIQMLSSASKATATRWDVPETKTKMIRSLAYADEILGNLLTTEEAKFSSKIDDIGKLEEHVSYMSTEKNRIPCFDNDA